MSLSRLFPTYPLGFRTPPKSKVKFGTRSIVVDFPWQAYEFYRMTFEAASQIEYTSEKIRKEWQEYLRRNKDTLTYHGKPLASISLRSVSFSERRFLRLDPKWKPLVGFLEEKAIHFLEDTKKDGRNIVKVYGDIWLNFFYAIGELTGSDYRHLPVSVVNFRKVLRQTGDSRQLDSLVGQFESVVKQIESSLLKKSPMSKLYTTNLLTNIQHLQTAVDLMDLPACYLILRNQLEYFVKLCVLLDVASSFDSLDLILGLLFVYDYEPTEVRVDQSRKKDETRIYSLDNFTRKAKSKISKMLSGSRSGSVELRQMMVEFRKTQVPKLGVNKDMLDKFAESNHLENTYLYPIYSACSAVIHNQPPLPFLSLLELKYFKQFLRWFLETFTAVAQKIIGSEIRMESDETSILGSAQKSLKTSLDAVYKLAGHEDQIRTMIKKIVVDLLKEDNQSTEKIWIKPFTLASFMQLISPNWTRLRDLSFTTHDLEHIVREIEPYTFKFAIQNEVQTTLKVMEERLIIELKGMSPDVVYLESDQQEEVAFYLLSLYLPSIVMTVPDNSSH